MTFGHDFAPIPQPGTNSPGCDGQRRRKKDRNRASMVTISHGGPGYPHPVGFRAGIGSHGPTHVRRCRSPSEKFSPVRFCRGCVRPSLRVVFRVDATDRPQTQRQPDRHTTGHTGKRKPPTVGDDRGFRGATGMDHPVGCVTRQHAPMITVRNNRDDIYPVRFTSSYK